MNKLCIDKDLAPICAKYEAHVYPIISNKLNFIIGLISVRLNLIPHNDLNNTSFSLNGTNYEIGNDPYMKKAMVNIVLNKKNKRSIGIGGPGIIDFSPLQNAMNCKRVFKSRLLNNQPYLYLKKNLKKILFEKLNLIENKTNYLHKKFKNAIKQEKQILNSIFDYPKFFHQGSKNTFYYALQLAQDLETPVCPYCNREYITSIKDVNGKKVTGPTFDHFLTQATYPFLALSFYNLIPCCSTCNSQLKFQIPFDIKHFLYPYNESYENIAVFKVFQKKQLLDEKLLNYQDLEIKIDSTPKDHIKLHGPIPNTTGYKKGNLNVFQTERIYNLGHINEVTDLLAKYKEFPKAHIDSLFKSLIKDQGKKEEDVYRFYFSNYLNEKDFNKRPLSRLTRDLTKQLNEIYGYKYFK